MEENSTLHVEGSGVTFTESESVSAVSSSSHKSKFVYCVHVKQQYDVHLLGVDLKTVREFPTNIVTTTL